MPHKSAKRRLEDSRRYIQGDDGEIVVSSKKRKVTITVHGWLVKEPTVASLNLDVEAVDKLIVRLTNIRANSSYYRLRKEGGRSMAYPIKAK